MADNPTPRPPATVIHKGSKGRTFEEQGSGSTFAGTGTFRGDAFKAKGKDGA